MKRLYTMLTQHSTKQNIVVKTRSSHLSNH